MRNKIFTVLLLMIVVAGTWWYVKQQAGFRPDLVGPSEGKNLQTAINGKLVEPASAERRPIAIVVENHPDARPQSGLSEADIVYESLTEGGITRFLALFQTALPNKVGPIRSARPNFNYLANMWGAAYVHVGGSEQALEQITTGQLPRLTDLNEFYNGKLFIRDDGQAAPHNAFTAIEKLRTWLRQQSAEQWQKQTLSNFSDSLDASSWQSAQSLRIPFSTPSYAVSYAYLPEQQRYNRKVDDAEQTDSTKKAIIQPATVIVQFMDAEYLPVKDTTSVNLDFTGQGSILIFHSGKQASGKWKNQNGQIRYYTNDGSDLTLPRGPIWVELLPKAMLNKITWK